MEISVTKTETVNTTSVASRSGGISSELREYVASLEAQKASGNISAEDLLILNIAANRTKEEAMEILQNIGRSFLGRLARMLTGETFNPKVQFYQNFDDAIFVCSVELIPKDAHLWAEGHMRRNGKLPEDKNATSTK